MPVDVRDLAPSVDALLAGAGRREPFVNPDGRSSAACERVWIEGVAHVVKYLHPDHDTMRASGDIGGRPARARAAGLLHSAPDLIDHAIVGARHRMGPEPSGVGPADARRVGRAARQRRHPDPNRPACHELCWHLALDRSRLPAPRRPRSTPFGLRSRTAESRPPGGGTTSSAFVGSVVQFGWEKALGDDQELAWWCDAARDGAAWL